MGSELRITAWTADETAALSAFEAAFGDFQRLDGLMSVSQEGSDVRAAERGRRQAARASQRRRPRGAARGPSGPRVDGRKVRRDVRGAVGSVEVRRRSRREAFPTARGVGRQLPLSIIAAVVVDDRGHGLSPARGGCARISVALERATPSIGRRHLRASRPQGLHDSVRRRSVRRGLSRQPSMASGHPGSREDRPVAVYCGAGFVRLSVHHVG